MKLNQAESNFREIMSMREEDEISCDLFVSLLNRIDIENVTTNTTEEFKRKEELEYLISEEIRKCGVNGVAS